MCWYRRDNSNFHRVIAAAGDVSSVFIVGTHSIALSINTISLSCFFLYLSLLWFSRGPFSQFFFFLLIGAGSGFSTGLTQIIPFIFLKKCSYLPKEIL
jgi:hypothetical protein